MPLEDLPCHNSPGWILFISSLGTEVPGSSVSLSAADVALGIAGEEWVSDPS